MKYTIGIDYGTLSGRAVLAKVATGEVVATATYVYPHGVMDKCLPDGTPLPDSWALQHPQDYLEVLDNTIPQILKQSGVDPVDIIAIGVDFTASTTLPVDKAGTPLCMYSEYAGNPHAYVKLWKHHGAQAQANRMTQIARERREDWLDTYGGKVSSEWSMPKLLQVLEEAPEIYDAMAHWVEAGDWVNWQLSGQWKQNGCAAGYKSQYRKGIGFLSEDYFAALDPRMRHVIHDKLSAPVIPVCSRAGALSEAMAARLGLNPGTAIAAAMVDAHACTPAAGVTRPGQVLAIIGTSAGYLTLGDAWKPICGIFGVVEDGIYPGSWAYEAGQTCVGDLFAWAADHVTPERYKKEAASRGISLQQYLTELAETQKPGEHGLVALDWWNGNRSILMDADLTGMILGMTLSTRAEDIYRALIESTAFGARTIIENYQDNGVPVRELFVTGGICQKNPMMMQIYADVLQIPLRIVGTSQGGALGSAIIAAAAAGSAAGGYDTVEEAIGAMAAPNDKTYYPCRENAPAYDRLYSVYRTVHDYFGQERRDLMAQLNALKRETKEC